VPARWSRGHVVATIIAVVVAIVFATGPPWWFSWFGGDGKGADTNVENIVGFSGSCEPFRVYAQNRWEPYGTVRRAAPDPAGVRIGGYSPNEQFYVDGWVHARVAYPTNRPPFDSDVWFHVADPSGGWVSFAGVRATPINRDPSGLGEGGPPVRVLPACEGVMH
jgi:hypothetical protein